MLNVSVLVYVIERNSDLLPGFNVLDDDTEV